MLICGEVVVMVMVVMMIVCMGTELLQHATAFFAMRASMLILW